MLFVIVVNAGVAQLGVFFEHGRRSPIHTLFPVSMTPAWLLGFVK